MMALVCGHKSNCQCSSPLRRSEGGGLQVLLSQQSAEWQRATSHTKLRLSAVHTLSA